MSNIIFARAQVLRHNIDGAVYSQDGTPLSNDAILAACPSVGAVEPHESRSKRFVVIPTLEVLDGMRKEGWYPIAAQQNKTRDASKREFTKHMITLRQAGDIQLGQDYSPQGHVIGRNIKQVHITNSAAGESAHWMWGGIFRSICFNGLQVPEGLMCHESVRHSGKALEQCVEAAFRLLDSFQPVAEAVEGMKALRLTEGQAEAFGHAALGMRFGNPDKAPITPRQMVEARRHEDREPTLWNLFNAAQENGERGGQHGYVIGDDGRRRNATVRAIKAIDGKRKFNQDLMGLAHAILQQA